MRYAVNNEYKMSYIRDGGEFLNSFAVGDRFAALFCSWRKQCIFFQCSPCVLPNGWLAKRSQNKEAAWHSPRRWSGHVDAHILNLLPLAPLGAHSASTKLQHYCLAKSFE